MIEMRSMGFDVEPKKLVICGGTVSHLTEILKLLPPVL